MYVFYTIDFTLLSFQVSSERHVQLSNYFIIDPQKGTILDPKDTFLNQNAEQIELKGW